MTENFDLEILNAWEVILGLVMTVLGAGWGAIAWIGQRLKDRDDKLSTEVALSRNDASARIASVEVRVDHLERQMSDGFDDLETRIESVERTLESVARKSDVEQLRVAQARVDARLEGMVENDRRLLAQLQGQGSTLSDMMKILVQKGAGA